MHTTLSKKPDFLGLQVEIGEVNDMGSFVCLHGYSKINSMINLTPKEHLYPDGRTG